MAYLTITMTAMTARINKTNITMAIMTGIASSPVEIDVASGIMCRVTVSLKLPNLFVTLQVYAMSLVVGMSVSSSKESFPLASTFPSVSSHSIVSTAKSVVQLRVAEVPYRREDSSPVILIP